MTSLFLPCREDVEDICSKEELVTFVASSQYSPDQSLTVKYNVGSRVQTTAFDWIGIFPTGWEDVTQSLTHVSSPPPVTGGRNGNHGRSKCMSVTFSAANIKALKSKNSRYQFVYVDACQQILGVSLPFKVTNPQAEDASDNDDSGSDSLVVLSSGPESDGEWELANQSVTLRQGDGGSSTSDLSDIVVLSCSPSQEAALQLEAQQCDDIDKHLVLADISWNSDSDDGQIEEIKTPKIVELPPEPTETISPGTKKSKARSPNSKESKTISPNTKESKVKEIIKNKKMKNANICEGKKSSQPQPKQHKGKKGNIENEEVVSIFSGKPQKYAETLKTKTCMSSNNADAPTASVRNPPSYQMPSLVSTLKIADLGNSSDEEDRVDTQLNLLEDKRSKFKLITEISKPETKIEDRSFQGEIIQKITPLENITKKVTTLENTTKKVTTLGNVTKKVTTLENLTKKVTPLENTTKKVTALETKKSITSNNTMNETSKTSDQPLACSQSKKSKKKRKKNQKRDENEEQSDDDDDNQRQNEKPQRKSKQPLVKEVIEHTELEKSSEVKKRKKNKNKEVNENPSDIYDNNTKQDEKPEIGDIATAEEVVEFVEQDKTNKVKKRKKNKKREETENPSDDDDDDQKQNENPQRVDRKPHTKEDIESVEVDKTCAVIENIPASKPTKLAFDELADIGNLDVRSQKEKMKEARRKERKAARSKGNKAGELTDLVCSTGQAKEATTMKSDKHEKENVKAPIDDASSELIQKIMPDLKDSESDYELPRRQFKDDGSSDLPGDEMKNLKRKYLVKAASRKNKRSTSCKRRSKTGCEVQYLFSMDFKATTTKESKSAVQENPEAAQLDSFGASMPVITLGPSAEDFPALPSQINTISDSTAMITPMFPTDLEQECYTHKEDDVDDDDDDSIECALSDGQMVPYVPPYVLDIMDNLPPANPSPDGRSLIEWKRAMQPLLPKHTLPAFHSKYKTKFARKHELKRMKLRRCGQGRQSAILDRIRNQFTVPGSLERIAKKLSRPLSKKPSNDQISDLSTKQKSQEPTGVTATAPSYANIVKQNKPPQDPAKQSSNDVVEVHTTVVSTEPIDQSPCKELVPFTQLTIEPSVPLELTETSQKQDCEKTCETKNSKVSSNFPKEFINYTSCLVQPNRETGETYSDVSQLQVVPFQGKAHTEETSTTKASFISSRGFALFGDKKLKTSPPTSGMKLVSRCDAPMVHTRRIRSKTSEKDLPKSSPPKHLKGNSAVVSKEKTSALLALPAPEGISNEWERSNLVDMALTSSIANNADLRSQVISLEKEIDQLRMENAIMAERETTREKQICSQQDLPPGSAKTSAFPKDPEERKMPVLKWAGKLSKLVRSNVEVISMSAKLKNNEQEIVSLTNQVNTLKEALQAETKRTTRALTKWFKLKLKVKVMRSKLRDIKTDAVVEVGQKSVVIPVERAIDNVAEEEFEPPCKRQRMNDTQEVPTFDTSVAPPRRCVSRASPSLLPPPSPSRSQAWYASPPSQPEMFSFLINNRSEPQTPRAVVAPQPQNRTSRWLEVPRRDSSPYGYPTQQISSPPYQQLLSQYQNSQNHVRPMGQRKCSPPHLPLPTPQMPNPSPPFRGYSNQMASNQMPGPRHCPFYRSPPPKIYSNAHDQLAWPLPSNGLQTNQTNFYQNTELANQAQLQQSWEQVPPQNSWYNASPPWTPYGQPNTQNVHDMPYAHPYSPRQAWVESSMMYANPRDTRRTQHQGRNPQGQRANCVSETPAQSVSPPGRYRSDFLRRMTRRDDTQQRAQPNPYRLFQHTDNTPQPPSCLSLPFSNGQTPVSSGNSSVNPNTASSTFWPTGGYREASYWNTPGFVELTADGLVEGSRQEMSAPYPDDVPGHNKSNGLIKSQFSFSRPIESSKAFEQTNN